MENHQVYLNPRLLYGRDLRAVLTRAIAQSRGAVTVAELVRMLELAGVIVDGRPGKVVSDALRAEVRRGRVVRERRGVYRAGLIPRTTYGRILHRAAAVDARLATRVTLPSPTPVV